MGYKYFEKFDELMPQALGGIDLQCAHLPGHDHFGQIEEYQRFMSPDEVQRYLRFAFDKDRYQFLMSRVLLRNALARHLGISPLDVKFKYGPYGKPYLPDHGNVSDTVLKFNLTHTDGMAIVAIARGRCIGVDVERIDRPAPVDVGVQQFHSREAASLLERAGDAAAFRLHFWKLWTLKESLVKATGLGLTIPLNRFDVSHLASGFSADNENATGPQCQPGTPESERPWYLLSWRPTDLHIAALCVERLPKKDGGADDFLDYKGRSA